MPALASPVSGGCYDILMAGKRARSGLNNSFFLYCLSYYGSRRRAPISVTHLMVSRAEGDTKRKFGFGAT